MRNASRGNQASYARCHPQHHGYLFACGRSQRDRNLAGLYVDETHVALSFQFFSKTHRNVRENPFAEVIVRDGQNFQEWHIEIQYDHSEESGRIFAMDVELEAIASMTGMSGIFKLRAADIYRVLSVRKSKSRG